MNRRDFLTRSVGGGAAIALASGFRGLPTAGVQTGYDIAAAKGEKVAAVKAVVDTLGGMGRFVKSGSKVVLKPNMSFPNPPEWGSTTHPDVVKAVAQLCLDAGASRVVVIDQPLRRPAVCLRRSGIAEALEGMNNTAVYAISEQKFYRKVSVPEGQQLKEVEIARDALDADVLISLPVAKSHNATGVSFGMKGMMGLIWDREYFHQFVDLNQAIADLCTVLRPALTITDATRALTTAGPNGPGKVAQIDTVVAGTDPVAVDSYPVQLAAWYGQEFTGSNVKYIKAAASMGLGEIDVSTLRIKEMEV